MLKKERESEIVNIIRERGGYMTVRDICQKVYSSESSIRRSLACLEEKGIINRLYGGVELIDDFSDITEFKKRAYHNSIQKRRIAEKAAELINDGEIIFLDQSSTAFYLAREISDRKNITVVTNNMEILNILSVGKANVISSGGMLSRENRTCFVGTDACRTFENIFADKVFFSTKAINNKGIYDCNSEETAVRYAMIKNAETKIFLCDSEKVGKSAHFKQCDINETDYIISEKYPDTLNLSDCQNLKILVP